MNGGILTVSRDPWKLAAGSIFSADHLYSFSKGRGSKLVSAADRAEGAEDCAFWLAGGGDLNAFQSLFERVNGFGLLTFNRSTATAIELHLGWGMSRWRVKMRGASVVHHLTA
jgi:hypothetical protein